jgi:hypothetical protein
MASISSIASTASCATTATPASPQKNFTARFQCKHMAHDELQEFWNLQQEEFKTCDPLQWWQGRKAQFPNLYHHIFDPMQVLPHLHKLHLATDK